MKTNGLKQRKTTSPFLEKELGSTHEEEYIAVLQAKAMLSASLPGACLSARCQTLQIRLSVSESSTPLVSICMYEGISVL